MKDQTATPVDARQMDAFALHALGCFAVVAFRPDKPDGSFGSGTLILVGERVVLLTAKHVVDPKEGIVQSELELVAFKFRATQPDVQSAGLVARDGPGQPYTLVVGVSPIGAAVPFRGFVLRAHLSERFDVALVEIKSEVEAHLRNLPLLALDDALAPAGDGVGADDSLCAVGLPAVRVVADPVKRRFDVTPLVHGTRVREGCGDDERHPRRGLHLDWSKAIAADGTRLHPKGISGGPVWRVRHVPSGEVWSPSKMGRIVGVASALYPKGDAPYCERCESVEDFGPWLRATAVEIAGAK